MNTTRNSALHSAADSAVETIDRTADTFVETVHEAAEAGASRVSGALRKAQDTAVDAKDALVAGAGSTLSSVRDMAVEKADEARETLSDIGERLASTLERASAEDPHDALKSRVLSSVAQSLTRASSTLRQRSVADLTDEVRLLAKRHPGAFMAAAAVVGFAAARFGRSSARRRGLGQPQGPYQGPQS